MPEPPPIDPSPDPVPSRDQQLRAQAEASCERRTLERDVALASEAAMGREVGRLLAEIERLRGELYRATDLLTEAMEQADESGADAFYRAIGDWMRADSSTSRAAPPDPLFVLRALVSTILNAQGMALNQVGAALGLPRDDDELNADYRVRILARLGVAA